MGEEKTRYRSTVRHRCPECGAAITWSCNGKKGYATCSNGITATRILDLDCVDTMILCDWQGFCERRPDGKVEIYYYRPI